MTSTQGTLFIVSAPSGAGKTSLVNALTEKLSSVMVSVSFTTRPQRDGEADGVHYNFVTNEQFDKMLSQADFLEEAVVFDNKYGTSQSWVEDKLNAGTDVILEIDWQGAAQVRKLIPSSISIFILPPSKQVLRSRLESRGQDDQGIINKRMEQAVDEMSHYAEYDYLLVNDNFDEALQQLSSIFESQRLGINKQQSSLSSLLTELLSR